MDQKSRRYSEDKVYSTTEIEEHNNEEIYGPEKFCIYNINHERNKTHRNILNKMTGAFLSIYY